MIKGDVIMKPASILMALALAALCAGPALAQVKLTPDEEAAFDRALEMMADDPAGARALVEPLANKGDGEALNFLAMLIQYGGPDWEPDSARADELREQAVKAGSEAAALNIAIGLMMDSNADHDRAVELLKMADTDESLRTLTAFCWGRAHLFGWGVDRDMARGVAYLETFISGGASDESALASEANFLLGRAYRNGWDVEIDHARAFSHFIVSADLGDPRAQWNAGMMLLEGEGVAADEHEAYRYVQMAAEAEHIDGMISLAVMLALGQGVDVDAATAREWYFKAAQRGSAHALRGLGMMLVVGEGGDASPALGFAMLRLAAEAGEEHAASLLSRIQNDMPSELDITRAQAKWVSDHGKPDPVN